MFIYRIALLLLFHSAMTSQQMIMYIHINTTCIFKINSQNSKNYN